MFRVGFLEAETLYKSLNKYLQSSEAFYFETQYLNRSYSSQEYHIIKERMAPGIQERFKIDKLLTPLILTI